MHVINELFTVCTAAKHYCEPSGCQVHRPDKTCGTISGILFSQWHIPVITTISCDV